MKATAIVAVVVVVCSVLVRKLQRTSRVQTAVEVSSALVKYRPPDVYSTGLSSMQRSVNPNNKLART